MTACYCAKDIHVTFWAIRHRRAGSSLSSSAAAAALKCTFANIISRFDKFLIRACCEGVLALQWASLIAKGFNKSQITLKARFVIMPTENKPLYVHQY